MPRVPGAPPRQVHPCPECGQTFTRTEFVTRHRQTKHLGVKPHHCACGNSYARSDILFRHRKKCAEAILEDKAAAASGDLPSPPAQKRRRSSGLTSSSGSRSSASVMTPSDAGSSPSGSSPGSLSGPSNPSYFGPERPYPGDLDPVALLDAATLSGGAGLDNVMVLGNADDLFEAVLQQSTGPIGPDWSKPSNRDASRTRIIDVVKERYGAAAPEKLWHTLVDPAWLKTDEPVDSPYYLSPSAFAVAFVAKKACGQSMPAVGQMSRFVRKAATTFLPFMPIFHLPTLNAARSPLHFSYSLVVAGASCEDDTEAKDFADRSLVPKRNHVHKMFVDRPFETLETRLVMLQTLLVFHCLGIYNKDESRRESAQQFVDQLVRNFQTLPIQQCVLLAPDYVAEVMSGAKKLDVAWKEWIRMEGAKRTVFLVLIASQHSNTPSELRLEDVDLPLPCHEDIWDARNEVEWLQKMASRRTQPPKLSDALFRPRPTDGTADDDDWMGSFALTVLTAAVSAAVRAGWTATEAEPAVV